ncbi:MAG: hypothetical protein CL441_09625 [Acidimicrobiaceae bacterium]|nr:hypothetical protein [Acidimicrobiaceae bacterium]
MTDVSRREFARRSFGATLGASALWGGGLSWGRVAQARARIQAATGIDPMSLMHPDLREVAEQLAQPGGMGRVIAGRGAGDPREAVTRMIPGRGGAPDVRVLISDPSPGAEGRPLYLHIHGGGYISGTASARFDVADAADCVVVSVDYRLAPDTPFPGSLEDNYAALKWAYDNADELGIDRTRIATGGESAGGGHAAMLAIAARDRGEVPLVYQVLIYPMIDDRTASTREVPDHIGTLIWPGESNRGGWEALLGQPPGQPTVPHGSVPSRVEDLSGLPAAWIGVGALDLFVAEDMEYGRRLIEAGVPVEMEIVPGAFHAFELFAPDVPVSQRFVQSWQDALRRAFEGA